jgi:hypothetical protein
MDRSLAGTWATIVVFTGLAVAALILTNALITALATEPSVTFSIVSPTAPANPSR